MGVARKVAVHRVLRISKGSDYKEGRNARIELSIFSCLPAFLRDLIIFEKVVQPVHGSPGWNLQTTTVIASESPHFWHILTGDGEN
jgi:hypothetical protein